MALIRWVKMDTVTRYKVIFELQTDMVDGVTILDDLRNIVENLNIGVSPTVVEVSTHAGFTPPEEGVPETPESPEE